VQQDSPGSSTPSDPAATGLVVAIETSTTGPTHVRVTVSNPSPDRLEFCRYHTPFEGIANKIFVVTSADGADVPYRGKMKKRAPPTRADYIKIRSGGSESTEVDLATGYTLPAGEYQVHFRGGEISGLPDSAPVTLVVP